VAYHQQVLDASDKTLIPSAQNAEPKALPVAVRPAFVGHLTEATQISSRLRRSPEVRKAVQTPIAVLCRDGVQDAGAQTLVDIVRKLDIGSLVRCASRGGRNHVSGAP
jgi:hypothetical protein